MPQVVETVHMLLKKTKIGLIFKQKSQIYKIKLKIFMSTP